MVTSGERGVGRDTIDAEDLKVRAIRYKISLCIKDVLSNTGNIANIL